MIYSARLMSKAKYGILCDRDTQQITQSGRKANHGVVFEDMGSIMVKGKAQEVRGAFLKCGAAVMAKVLVCVYIYVCVCVLCSLCRLPSFALSFSQRRNR